MQNARERKSRYPLLQHPVATAVVIFVLFGLLRALVAVSAIMLIWFLAIFLATLLTHPLNFFARYLPRVVALLVTLVFGMGAGVGLVFLAVPVLNEQARRLLAELPTAQGRLEHLWSRIHGATGASQLMSSAGLADRLAHEAELLLGQAVPFAADLLSVGGTGLAVVALGFFLAYSPESYRDGLAELVPPAQKPLLLEAWTLLGDTLRRWTAGIVCAMLTMGLLAGIGLAIAGIDVYFLLGILTGIGTFVPYVGALASAVPGLLVGLAKSPTHFLYAAIVYLGVHLIEGYVVEPLIMRRAVRLRPAVLLFWQLLMAALFGLPGIIVATPLLACLDVSVRTFWVERCLRSGSSAPLRGDREAPT